MAAVTAFELRVGADSAERSRGVEAILRGRTLPLDLAVALRAGEAFARLRSTGHSIDVKDALIAGTCLRFGLPLATRNVRHFARVPGLQLMGTRETP